MLTRRVFGLIWSSGQWNSVYRRCSLYQSQVMSQVPGKQRKTSRKKTVEITSAPDSELYDKAKLIAQQLTGLYGSPAIPLSHNNSFQLLVAVMLSAQSTDKKVNEVTSKLFALAADAKSMACLQVEQIQDIIKPIGLAPTKSKNVSAMSKLLVERHSGEVPCSFEELEALPGVGHKTASVVMSQAFGHAAFPVDTHIHRLAARWGLSNGTSVEQTEADLKVLFPSEIWRDLHLQIILFGREHCPAKQHNQSICPICSWAAASVAEGLQATPAPAVAAGSKPKKRKAFAAAAPEAINSTAAAAAGATVVTATSPPMLDGSHSRFRTRRKGAA